MSTIYRLQFLLIAAAAILATAFPANAQTTLEAVKQKGVLVAGSSAEYPPFEYVADGKLVGYDVDMAEEITRRMGVKVAWEKIDFKGIVAALTAKRVDVLARLCAEGYAGKMVLSHDANCWSDMLSEENKRRTRPQWHYNHISDDILPALRKAGVSEDQIDQMLVRNPRAIFEATPARRT